MSFHFIVRFQPCPGMEAAFRDELLRVNEPSRDEVGCLRIDVFESIQGTIRVCDFILNGSMKPRSNCIPLCRTPPASSLPPRSY